MPSTTTTEGRIELRDGRRLGYAEYGDPHGQPIFYFHGFHGSRLEAGIAGGAASRMGARIVAPDRPGYGLSDFKPGRAIADWPDDAIQLADALDIERFAVLGVSGGGPYALACALKVPQRLTTVGILSGLGPPDAARAAREMALPVRVGAAFGRKFPLLVTLLFQLVTGRIIRRHTERVVALISARSSAPDAAALARPDVRPVIIESLRESVRPGGRGVAWDLVLYSRPWGFRLGDVSMPVHLWHGEADTIVPPAFGRYQADAIPHCRAEFFPGEGHISVGVNHADEILRALLEG
jgi:pimeloyl-ACP methyl ester carboxylesterase